MSLSTPFAPDDHDAKALTLRVNGRVERISVPAHRTLLEALRQMGHTEVKCGCEKGDCGACAVLLDGVAIDSCLTLAWLAEGREITTVAGLADDGASSPLQRAFAEMGAAQCGYCIPGILVAASDLLARDPDPDDETIRLALSGNLCRCTGYTLVVEAVRAAAAEIRGEETAS